MLKLIYENKKDIIVTIPKKELKNMDAENKLAESDGTQFWNLKIKPKDIDIGSKIYFCQNGYIDSYQIITNIVTDKMKCDVTNREWNGVNLILSYPPVYLKNKIPCKGFQGFRYYQ
jgi:hypothetical protein